MLLRFEGRAVSEGAWQTCTSRRLERGEEKRAHGFPIGQFEFDFKAQIVIGQIIVDGVSDIQGHVVIADAG